jgi:hypothetical protein
MSGSSAIRDHRGGDTAEELGRPVQAGALHTSEPPLYFLAGFKLHRP